jgi:integrase
MFTGVRRGEALALTWDRVDRARGVVRLGLTKSGKMTMRYSHLAPDHLRAAVAVLDGVLSSLESEPTKVSAQGSAQESVAIGGMSTNSLK